MRRVAAVLALALASAPEVALAQLEFEGDSPRVFSIQRRPYRLGHEFQLGLGVLPLDAFYVGAVVGAGYTYHISDFWSWEIASGNYSLNFGTGLRGRLLDQFSVEPVRGGGDRIKVFGTTSLVVKPLFGKLAIFNRETVYSETFFLAGIGPMLKGETWKPTVAVGGGMRFWVSQSISIRLDIRDQLVFATLVPENTLFIMLSTSLNYYNVAEREGMSWP
ncbi:MAG: outer membrane beta-barrel domain-containing protein [Deltaproteobacteria bacterium]|nr:outer membrane beta-barrel domain-containing protein [Deltaproteobacteria bacterium]